MSTSIESTNSSAKRGGWVAHTSGPVGTSSNFTTQAQSTNTHPHSTSQHLHHSNTVTNSRTTIRVHWTTVSFQKSTSSSQTIHQANTTLPTAPTPTPSQAPDSQATQPPPDSSSTPNTASQATDTNTATSNPTPAPPGPPPTIGQPTPQYQPRTRHDPYTHIHTQVKAAPPLPENMAWKMAPGKWGDPLQIVQAMVDTTTELVNKADKVLEKRQGNINTTPTAGSTPLPPPPPPPPPTTDASQCRPITTQKSQAQIHLLLHLYPHVYQQHRHRMQHSITYIDVPFGPQQLASQMRWSNQASTWTSTKEHVCCKP